MTSFLAGSKQRNWKRRFTSDVIKNLGNAICSWLLNIKSNFCKEGHTQFIIQSKSPKYFEKHECLLQSRLKICLMKCTSGILFTVKEYLKTMQQGNYDLRWVHNESSPPHLSLLMDIKTDYLRKASDILW